MLRRLTELNADLRTICLWREADMPRSAVTDEGVHPADYAGSARRELARTLYLLASSDHFDPSHRVRLRPIDQHAALIRLAANIVEDAALSEAETDPLKVVKEW